MIILLLIWRVMRAADLANDPFGRLICVGVATLIFFQSFVNLGRQSWVTTGHGARPYPLSAMAAVP